jgi:hypothetical protein
MYEEHKDSAVGITNYVLGFIKESDGTGFMVGASNKRQTCDIATNHHVIIGNWSKHTVELLNGQTYSGRVVLNDLPNDLAILRLYGVPNAEEMCKVLSIDPTEHPAKPGEPIFMLTWPVKQPETLNQQARAERPQVANLGTSNGYLKLDSIDDVDWQEGESREREIADLGPTSYSGDSGAAFLDMATGKVVGVSNRGAAGLSTFATPSNVLQKDIIELSQRDADEERAEAELPGP